MRGSKSFKIFFFANLHGSCRQISPGLYGSIQTGQSEFNSLSPDLTGRVGILANAFFAALNNLN